MYIFSYVIKWTDVIINVLPFSQFYHHLFINYVYNNENNIIIRNLRKKKKCFYHLLILLSEYGIHNNILSYLT